MSDPTKGKLITKIQEGGVGVATIWLLEHCKERYSSDYPECEFNHDTLRFKVNKTFARYKTYRKNAHRQVGQDKLDNFLAEKLELPKPKEKSQPKPTPLKCSATCSYADASANLAEELKCVEEKLATVTETCDSQKEEISHLKKKSSRVKFEKLKQEKKTWKNEKETLKARCQNLEIRLEKKTNALKTLRKQKDRLSKQVDNKNTKIGKLRNDKEGLNKDLKDKSEKLDTSVNELKDYNEANEYLQQVLNDNIQLESEVHLFDEDTNQYTTETRHCIYQLLQLNVPSRSIGPVIKCICDLCGKTVDNLPSKSTILNMNVERLMLAQQQIGEEVASKEDTTLYTDETSKFGAKYGGYHVSDAEGRYYVLGMRNLATKSAADTLKGLQDILQDINDRSGAQDNLTAKRLLVHISATMSDRAATEVKFNDMLETLRADILPEMKANWNDLSPADQLASSQLLNFFCGLHSLVHFAEAASGALSQLDQGLFQNEPPIHDPSFRKKSESGSARLVRTASNALGRGGDEKNGRYGDFKTFTSEFIKESGLHSLPVEPYHGNRFNVLFENAVAIFFLSDKIQNYLQDHQTNGLLKSVLHDIRTPEYLAGVKALALISRFVTSPLWRLLENKEIHVFAMNSHYRDLVTNLEVAVGNLDDFMQGKVSVFGDVAQAQDDVMLRKLLEPWEHDDKVRVALSVLLPAIAMSSKKLFKDHLPEGKWSNVTDEMMKKSQSAHKHNKFAESAFAYLDHLLRKSPSITTLSSEAYLMFLANRTNEWLQSKTDEERQKLIDQARKQGPLAKRQFKERQKEIHQQHLLALQQAAELTRERERRRVATLEKHTNAIIFHGLWQSEEQVDIFLSTMSTKKGKREALKAQLNFRNHVLKQDKNIPDYDNVFSFTKRVDGRSTDCSIDDLTSKVKAVIRHAYTLPDTPASEGTPLLVGKVVRHKFARADDPGSIEVYTGTVISQVSSLKKFC